MGTEKQCVCCSENDVLRVFLVAVEAAALQAAAQVNSSLCCRERCDCVGSQRGRTGANDSRAGCTNGLGQPWGG